MTKKKSGLFVSAAIVGILGAATLSTAHANEPVANEAKGHCVGANSCKGQGACKTVGKNDCGGKNGCGGKGFLEKTKAECDALAVKNKKIHFEAMKG
ncbi:MAG: BufA2 family periplasmic bufferin-type metallophore [Bacteriovorax sp.]